MKKNQDELFRFVDYSAEAAERIGYSNYSYWRSVLQNFLKKKAAVAMAIIFVAVVIFSFVALEIGKYDYHDLMSNKDVMFTSPNAEYWFGTDNLGRDLWTRVWEGGRVSMLIALIS